MDPTTLFGLRTRGEIKRGGAWLDGEGRAERAAVVQAARARGADVPEDWAEMDGRRLLRACLAREDEAQVRTNPIHRDESFLCAHCGADVPLGGRRPRDHCPRCLWSLHVDTIPGDRAAGCGGAMIQIAAEPSPKGWMLRFRCQRCGIERRNRVLNDLEPPDDPEAVRKLVSQPGSG